MTNMSTPILRNPAAAKNTIMTNEQTRLWHVTATWNKQNSNHARCVKDFIITAKDKSTALAIAKNRLPANLREVNIRSRDLGRIRDQITYFSSGTKFKDKETTPQTSAYTDKINVITNFAIAWGTEIGWREMTKSISEPIAKQFNQLKAESAVEQLLSNWADEYIKSDSDKRLNQFFTEKFTKYLETHKLDTKETISLINVITRRDNSFLPDVPLNDMDKILENIDYESVALEDIDEEIDALDEEAERENETFSDYDIDIILHGSQLVQNTGN